MPEEDAKFQVVLAASAVHDVESIWAHLAETAGPAQADVFLERLLEAGLSLSRFPGRGSRPRDVLEIGVEDLQQILYKSYRILYHIAETRVTIYMIADGRRDMRTLLAQRLWVRSESYL